MHMANAPLGFGLAIVQYLDRLGEAPGAKSPYSPHAPAPFGLALIAAGVLGPLLSIWQYRSTLRYVWSGSFSSIAGTGEERMPSAALAGAILLIRFGVACVAVLVRLA
jgi:putative membrane protein